jgi:hypothetical protein
MIFGRSPRGIAVSLQRGGPVPPSFAVHCLHPLKRAGVFLALAILAYASIARAAQQSSGSRQGKSQPSAKKQQEFAEVITLMQQGLFVADRHKIDD